MATLADSFLADFESDDEEDEKEKDADKGSELKEMEQDLPEASVTEMDFDADESKEEKSDTVGAVVSLLTDSGLKTHLTAVERLMKSTEDATGIHRNVDREQEYPVIVRSNELAVQIDNETALLHKVARDIYGTKFHELEQMVQLPVEYAKVVKVIGNETDITKVEKELANIIAQQTILTITVTATSTIGKPLPEAELKRLFEACDAIVQLDDAKKKIYAYVESRMNFIAPNISAIVGSDIAARLVGIAGGVTALSKIPACNIQVLGVKRKTTAGMSTARADLHVGIIGQCDLILACPPDLKNKLLRLVASKVALAARVDSFQEDPEGNKGNELREEIEHKLAKWQEPPPAKQKRALPAPNDKPRKKRGGKRYRKYKEKYEQTDVAKAKNRMVFGKAEQTDDFTGEGYGMLGQSGSGALTFKQKDTQKLKNKISQKTQARMKRIKTTGPSQIAGTASSIAFTPVQGMELVNPDLQDQKRKQLEKINASYFSTTATFSKVGSASSTPGAGTKAGGTKALEFKAPVPKFS